MKRWAKIALGGVIFLTVLGLIIGSGDEKSKPKNPLASKSVGSAGQCQERVVDFIDSDYLAEGDVVEPGATDLALEVRKGCRIAPSSERVESVAELVRSRLFIKQSGSP